MSLLGRLEDLPITDILQIVFLSRRTGVLEIVRGDARSQVLFQRGLIVGARSSDVADLGSELLQDGNVTPEALEMARRAASREPVTPLGQTLVELGLVAPDDLGKVIVSMMRRVIEPLMGCEDGEFNFLLREALDPVEIEYQPEEVFRDKGVSPQKLLAKDGEKIVPLKALQDQMRTGKVLLSQRGLSVEDSKRARESQVMPIEPAAPSPAVEPPPEVGEETHPASPEALHRPPPRPVAEPQLPAVEPVAPPPMRPTEIVQALAAAPPLPPSRPTLDFVEIPATEEDLASIGPLILEEPTAAEAAPLVPSVSVIVASTEEDRRRAFEERTVVLLETDPLVRVAVKRVLGKKGIRTFHFDDADEVLRTLRELYDQGKFFVTILGIPSSADASTISADPAAQLLDFVRKLGRGYPALATTATDDHRLRRELYRHGADVVLSRPRPGSGGAVELEQELAAFGDEITILAERWHDAWDVAQSEDVAPARESGGAIAELGRRERGRRSLAVLKNLIADLAGTTEVTDVALMILRVAGEYLDRAVFFLVGQKDFVGLGGYGVTGDGTAMNLRVRRIRIPVGEPSIFSEVRRTKSPHRGRLKKTEWNQKLIAQLGTIYPTEIVAIPVVHRDRVLAIVYGDNARDKVPIGAIDGLEIFLAQAGYAFEAALLQGRKRRTAPGEATHDPAAATGGPA